MKKYAITDIHGCNKSFQALIDKIALSTSDELYLLGDYIDRGPDSKGVFDTIFKLKEEGYSVHCLRGNHEEMLLNGFKDSYDLRVWQSNGGWEMLKSFGARHPREIDDKYLDFIKNLDYYFEVDEYILVHAGMYFFDGNPFEHKDALLWLRGWYNRIDYDWLGERIIVHGHTPVYDFEWERNWPLFEENKYLDIDTGCVFTKRVGLGRLCAFNMTDRKVTFQKNVEDY